MHGCTLLVLLLAAGMVAGWDERKSGLQAEVEDILRARGGRGSWSVSFSLFSSPSSQSTFERGRGGQPLLVDINTEALRTPASNVKLLTASTAFLLLNPSNTRKSSSPFLQTQSLLSCSPSPSGSLVLCLRGAGDPSLSSADLVGLANRTSDALHSSSSSATLSVSVLSTGFGEGFTDSTWEEEDLDFPYGAPIAPLMADGSTAPFLLSSPSSSSQGERLHGEWRNAGGLSGGTKVVVKATVAGKEGGEDAKLSWRYARNEGAYVVEGELAAGATHQLSLPVVDPARYAGEIFRHAMEEEGWNVEAGVISSYCDNNNSSNNNNVDENSSSLSLLAKHDAPPLLDLLSTMLKESNNQYAETFLRILGREGEGGKEKEEGRMTGLRVIASEMKKLLGTDAWDAMGYVQRDGSGLSRHNLIPAVLLHRLLEAMATVHRGGEGGGGKFPDLLPVSCFDGTLVERFCELPRGTVRAKTGTMGGVSALSGYVMEVEESDGGGGGGGGVMKGVFSIVVNSSELTVEARQGVIDDIVRCFVKYSREKEEKSKEWKSGRKRFFLRALSIGGSALFVVGVACAMAGWRAMRCRAPQGYVSL